MQIIAINSTTSVELINYRKTKIKSQIEGKIAYFCTKSIQKNEVTRWSNTLKFWRLRITLSTKFPNRYLPIKNINRFQPMRKCFTAYCLTVCTCPLKTVGRINKGSCTSFFHHNKRNTGKTALQVQKDM